VEAAADLTPIVVVDLGHRFGLNVKAARKRAGLSQETLAHMAGVTRSYMSDVERAVRNPTLQVVERIATALGVGPGSLMD
jgi:transcriptional regulator with XRE-family HTH domain